MQKKLIDANSENVKQTKKDQSSISDTRSMNSDHLPTQNPLSRSCAGCIPSDSYFRDSEQSKPY